MVAIQRRDRLAFEGLYRGYYPRLAPFLARFATSRASIEEIISDTFMVIWTQASNCRHESKVSTSEALSFQSRRTRRRQVS